MSIIPVAIPEGAGINHTTDHMDDPTEHDRRGAATAAGRESTIAWTLPRERWYGLRSHMRRGGIGNEVGL